jgi:hypothetical protein
MQSDVVGEPLQRVAVDILGPLDPPTSKGSRYVLVIVDYLTKWAEAYAMPSQTAEDVALPIVQEFVCRLGIPRQLHSDQGRQFESALFQQVCKLLGIHKTRTTPLYPQSDGQTERMNRTLLDVLAKLARERPRDWDDYLCFAMASYRSSVHSTTKETPNRLMLGREVATPATLLSGPVNEIEEQVEWVNNLRRKFEETHRIVTETTKAVHRTAKVYFDRKQKGYLFDEGQLVWVYDPKPKKNQSHKLDANKWSGPWVVTKRISACVYLVVRHVNDRKGRVLNVDRLLPFVPRKPSLVERQNVVESEDTGQLELSAEELQDTKEYLPESNEEDTGVPEEVEEFYLQPMVVTTRAKRQAQRPRWQQDFNLV